MKKLFCDLCEKIIKDHDYVSQSVLFHYDFNESIESEVCKKCWEIAEKKVTSKTQPKNKINEEEKQVVA